MVKGEEKTKWSDGDGKQTFLCCCGLSLVQSLLHVQRVFKLHCFGSDCVFKVCNSLSVIDPRSIQFQSSVSFTTNPITTTL
jgi:hypothetical protein